MDSDRVLINIRKIVRSINLESKRIQKTYGISIPQLLSLIYLSNKQDNQSTQKELKAHLQLNSSTVTGIVNRLEKKGLIARLPKKHDKRMTYIALTSAGEKILKKAPNLMQEKLQQRLKEIPESKLNDVLTSLDFLIDALDIHAVDASPFLMVNDPLDDLSE